MKTNSFTDHILRLALLSLVALFPYALQAQEEKPDTLPDATTMTLQVGKVAYRGDSIANVIFPPLQKYPPLTFKNAKEAQKYQQLVANVKRVLPFAKLARLTIVETYEILETMPSQRDRAAHLKMMEEALKAQYTPILKRLSRSQGRLLVKLIDRECGQSGYQIASAFLGSFKANVYQSVAFLFGQSLTKRYDPTGDDFMIERVVRLVEAGQI